MADGCAMVRSMSNVTKNAIKRAGGAPVIARELGLTRQAVNKWDEVPSKHVLAIEKLSGVTRYELRPDLYGPFPGPFVRPSKSRMAA